MHTCKFKWYAIKDDFGAAFFVLYMYFFLCEDKARHLNANVVN
jgi:hypothetical protein